MSHPTPGVNKVDYVTRDRTARKPIHYFTLVNDGHYIGTMLAEVNPLDRG